ncbi:MAG: PqqD family protein [Actinomycetota bacterium]
MITETTTLTVRGGDVVHESVDGEVVIVDLASGVYFSTDGVGAVIWEHLSVGTSLSQLAEWARTTYPDVADAPEAVSMFVQQAHAQSLLAASEDPTPPAPEVPAPDTYVAPTLQAFNDMESLLLLDPIHDVEPEKGWPAVG